VIPTDLVAFVTDVLTMPSLAVLLLALASTSLCVPVDDAFRPENDAYSPNGVATFDSFRFTDLGEIVFDRTFAKHFTSTDPTIGTNWGCNALVSSSRALVTRPKVQNGP
jgi:hypothetical protein